MRAENRCPELRRIHSELDELVRRMELADRHADRHPKKVVEISLDHWRNYFLWPARALAQPGDGGE